MSSNLTSPISGQADSASVTETEDSVSIPGRVKSEMTKIATDRFSA